MMCISARFRHKTGISPPVIKQHDDRSGGSVTLNSADGSEVVQILVVDDSDAVRGLFVWFLRQSGYRVITAVNGLEAQHLLRKEHPTLIISDLNMPVCNGWELLAFCHRQHPGIPVLLVSGEGLGTHPEIERWAAAFVAKPFDIQTISTKVERLIAQAIGGAGSHHPSLPISA